jgi:imidazolonepropionase-like amidohydrolase
MNQSILSARALALSLPLLVPAAVAQDLVAVKAGKVITVSGEPIQDAVILIENGKIKEVGKGLEIPWNATVIDAAGQVVMPAWVIAHSSGGLDRENENMPVTPFLSVTDAVDPSNEYFEQALRDGIGTIHVLPGNRTIVAGQGIVVQPYGKTVEEMMVRTKGGMKMSLQPMTGGRVGHVAKVRRVFEELKEYRKDYERRKKEFEEEKALPASDPQAEFEEEFEAQKKPLIELLEGKFTAFVYTPGPADVIEALKLAKTYGFELVLVVGPACYKAASLIKEAGVPVILESDVEFYEKDPETDEEKLVCPAKVFDEAGVQFALSHETSAGRRMGFGSAAGSPGGQYPWLQAAIAVRHGVARDTAIKALTSVPAGILGMADRVGTIEPGRDANLQILTGEPLAARTWVDKVVLQGQVAYDRSKDKRLARLLAEPAKAEKPEKPEQK